MRGVRIHAYGSPECLVYEQLSDPSPGKDEVVVDVMAAGVNPADYKYRSGQLAAVSPKSLPFVPGMDIAGTISAVGAQVSGFSPGDRVLAMLYLMGNGGYAERVAVPAAWCATLPAELNFATAAALPTPATTASEWIDCDLQIERGQRILVTGATGAVGRIACYAAQRRGARVTAAVRRQQLSDVRYADDVVVLNESITSLRQAFDGIADTIGGATASALLSTLRPGGILSTIATDPIENPGIPDVTTRFFGNHADAARLATLAAAVATKELLIRPPSIMRLSDAAQAHVRMERGGAGKIVLVPDALYQATRN
jgi:NADPH2:quinone reductase